MESIENKLEILKKDYEILEQKFAEKSFKFLAINQTTKTIASEKGIPNIKKLILDMLFEVSLVQRGLCFEIKDNNLKVNGVKNIFTPFDKNGIDLNNRENELNLLNGVNLIKIQKLKEKNILPEIFDDFNEGYCLTFMGQNKEYETMFIVLGEKSFGVYNNIDEEFLITIRGQVEIILENAIKTALIENKNKELLEKNFNLRIINSFSSTLSSTLEIKTLYSYIKELINKNFSASNIHIFTYENNMFIHEEEEKGFLSIAVNSIKETCKEYILNGNIGKEKHNIHQSDFYKDIAYLLGSSQEGVPYIVPLVANHNLLGILAFKSKNDIDIDLLEALKNQMSIYIYNATLYTMAITDSMTKLYLQTFFKEKLDNEIKKYEEHKNDISLIMLDIDHFKKFNDTYGHLAGDFVIKEVANLIKDSVRAFDIVSRYGGEEFAIMLLDTKLEIATLIAERIRVNIEKRIFLYDKKELKVHVSLGLAHIHDCENDLSSHNFISKADEALYFSKRNGRNRLSIYSQLM